MEIPEGFNFGPCALKINITYDNKTYTLVFRIKSYMSSTVLVSPFSDLKLSSALIWKLLPLKLVRSK